MEFSLSTDYGTIFHELGRLSIIAEVEIGFPTIYYWESQ